MYVESSGLGEIGVISLISLAPKQACEVLHRHAIVLLHRHIV